MRAFISGSHRSVSKSTFFLVLLFTYLWPVALFQLVELLPDGRLYRYGMTVLGALGGYGVAFWALRRDDLSLADLGWTVGHLRRALKVVLAVWGLWTVVTLSRYAWKGQPLGEGFQTSWMYILVQWLFVGPEEELLFRGYMLTRLMQCFSRSR